MTEQEKITLDKKNQKADETMGIILGIIVVVPLLIWLVSICPWWLLLILLLGGL